MKRLEEKVRDIVDVRASANLNDFLADPTSTLGGYHFTDITADLMAKWIDRIADVKKGQGVALALAGFRGVGKSHFLAALGAIISKPELRSGITDSHVMTKAQRLSRRHGVVAHVRRGSSNSLLTELKNAIAETIGGRTGELSDSLNELLSVAADKSGEMPFVLLIDTAVGRESRVARDDGALLSEIAVAGVRHGIFIGIALDDDIAGADGMNSSIASSYAIDYLDQEHLYKIVNAYVFAKQDQMRPILHEIYESYRAALPGFRWSEHRFSSLYPLHPAILEISPFVRLYLHDFALLGFAAEAGLKILGRPANSLIGLDEVFDNVETRLRAVSDLKEAFAAYDSLDQTVIAKIPVMKRHEAKLILKGLLLLSFSGEGVTATELSAAMLIFDEAHPAEGVANVEKVLRAFSDDMPGSVKRSENPDREAKFSFKLGGEDDLSSTLAEVIATVSSDVAETVLKRQTAEKFSDFEMSEDGFVAPMGCQVVWRGGIRHGEVVWVTGDEQPPEATGTAGEWKVFIRYDTPDGPRDKRSEGLNCEWRLAALTTDDIDTIRRFHVLQADTELRERFRESIPTVLHTHSIAVDKIWQRVFLEESRFVSGESEFRLTEEAISSFNLAHLFATMLEDHFELHFPSHPEFLQILGTKETSLLTEHLFSGAGINGPEIQQLAANLALPLGLVKEHEGVYVPLSAGELAELALVKEILDGTDPDKTEVIPINELSARMVRAPYGLTQEARHLVLAALVAQRQFEFVTSSGNRINHRSLDLQIIWDDIVGIARPSGELYSGDRLLVWAVLLTGDASLKGLKASEERLQLIGALSDWLTAWQGMALMEKFDMLPDEKLNSKLWRAASNIKRAFTVVAESIDSLVQNGMALDQCLQTIADVFSDSEAEFESKQEDLAVLRDFIGNAGDRDEISTYLTLCEPTNDPETEKLRYFVMNALATGYFEHREADDFRDSWTKFKGSYSTLYAQRHDSVMASGNVRGKLDEFLATDLWTTFADLSTIPWFGRQDIERAMGMIREFRSAECHADVRVILEAQPFCRCSFRLANGKAAEMMIAELASLVTAGMDRFRRRLHAQNAAFTAALNEMNPNHSDRETLSALKDLVSFLEENKAFPRLSAREIHALKTATRNLPGSNALSTDRRRPAAETPGALHPDDISELEDELDRLQDVSKLGK